MSGTANASIISNVDLLPDIHSLFAAFNGKFFQRKLKYVQIEWSQRMKQCAGICYQYRNRENNSITIRLSEPLLKSRPRQYLITTILHEMIHAYLFIENIRESNGGHGLNFINIMEAINRLAGTNISVYHNFHDARNSNKVEYFWRCNGICEQSAPFYGLVRKTNDQAPGPSDIWWGKHRAFCHGLFKKIQVQPDLSNKNHNKHGYVETPATQNWIDLDDSLIVCDEKNPIIELCDDDDDSELKNINNQCEHSSSPPVIIEIHDDCDKGEAIKRELLEDLGETEANIELIDSEFIDTFDATKGIHKLLDNLMTEFNRLNQADPISEIIACPICQNEMFRKVLYPHLEGCIGIMVPRVLYID